MVQISVNIDNDILKEMREIRDKTGLPVSKQVELKLKGFSVVSSNKTTIQLSKRTVKCLKKIGKKNETYDDIIKGIIHKLCPNIMEE